MRPIDQAMYAYWNGGLSIIPINPRTKRPASWLLPQAVNELGQPLYYRNNPDGSTTVTTERTKSPKGAWEPYAERQPTREELQDWISAGVQSIALVCGEVSGGVEILDFDVVGYFEAWEALTNAFNLPKQRTGGGGIQIAWRCPNPQGNQKLAWHPDPTAKSGRRIAIETRGQHGYALLPPSLHPSGRHYELLRGRFSQIPMISDKQRGFFLEIAQSLCQAPKTKQELAAEARGSNQRSITPYEGTSVVEAFNNRYDVHLLLQRYGYERLANGRYGRPGKKDSAGIVVFDDNKTYHYSSNDSLDSDHGGRNQPRSPFDFYVQFGFNGDYKRAVAEAAKELGMSYKSDARKLLERYGINR